MLDAFNAARSTSASFQGDIVTFTYIFISNGSSFKILSLQNNFDKNGLLIIQTLCLYWILNTIDVAYQSKVDVSIDGGPAHLNLYQSYASPNYFDSISRCGIASLKPAQNLTMKSRYLNSDRGINQTYWAGFRIDNLFQPLIVIGAITPAGDYPIYFLGQLNQPIKYEIIWLNLGLAWNYAKKLFTAPISGIYFFSFSIGVVFTYISRTYELHLLVQQNLICSAKTSLSNYLPYDGIMLLSKSCLLSLTAGDDVAVVNYPVYISDIETFQTVLHGFLYSPQYTQQVCFILKFLYFIKKFSGKNSASKSTCIVSRVITYFRCLLQNLIKTLALIAEVKHNCTFPIHSCNG